MSEQIVETGIDPDLPQEDRKVSLGRTVVWIVVGLIIIFLSWGLINAFSAQPTEGEAPDFTLTTYDGSETYTLSELQGQVVVINFWASWCVPCEEEADDLEAAWQFYKDKGVQFLGVAYVDSEAKALEFIAEHGVTYPNGPDLRSQISDLYEIRGVPETFIVDANGEITFFAMEPLTFSRLSAEIDKALAQQ